MQVVLITGPPGAGKSSTLTALSDALADDGVPHAVVEAEAVAWAHPPLDQQQAMQGLRAVCLLHRQAGYPLLLVAATAVSEAELHAVLEATGADEYFVVPRSRARHLAPAHRPPRAAELVRARATGGARRALGRGGGAACAHRPGADQRGPGA